MDADREINCDDERQREWRDGVLIGTNGGRVGMGCMGSTHTPPTTLALTGKTPAFRCELNEGGRDGGKCHRLPASHD